MVNALDTINHYLSELGNKIGTTMKLYPTSCMLVDEQGQVRAVITTPEASDIVLFHRELMEEPKSAEHRHQLQTKLLTLNGEIETLKGCWLSVDQHHSGIHLMTSRVIEQINYQSFENLLIHFVELCDQIQQTLLTYNGESAVEQNPVLNVKV